MSARLKTAASIAVAGLFIYWFAHKLDWLQVWSDARKAEWSKLGLAATLLVATYLVRAIRWKALLSPMAHPSVRALLRATVIGFTALFVVGRAGEMIVRPAALSMEEDVRPSASYATVMIERVFDMVMVVVLFAVNLAFFQFTARDAESLHTFGLIRVTGIFLLLVSAAGIFGLSVFRRKRASVIKYLERKLARLPKPVFNAVINLLKHISEGLAVLHDVKGLAIVVFYTVLLWSMVVAAYVLLIRGFGIPSGEVPITGAVFVMGLSMLGSAVPSPAASTGPFHAATAASLVFLGVDRNRAASAAIILHLVIFLPAVFFGLFYVIKDGVSFARLMGAAKEAGGPALTRPDGAASIARRKKAMAAGAGERAIAPFEHLATPDALQNPAGDGEPI